MRRWIRGALGGLVAVALLAGPAGAQVAGPTPTPSHDPAGDNAAVAVNTVDGSSIFELAFSIHEVTGDAVTNQNVAVAYASCVDCQTVAIAIQIVLVFSSPETVTPVNVAAAVNEQCTSCTTFAAAYQWVLGTGGPVELSEDGEERLEELQERLEELGEEGPLSPEELQAILDEVVAEISDILATELVPIEGDDDDDDEGGDDDDDDDDGARKKPSPTAVSPTPSPSVSPSTSVSPSPSPSVSTSPTPSVSVSASPSPSPSAP